MKLLIDPHLGILRRIMDLIMARHRDKIIRASYRIFLRVAQENDGLRLLVNLGLRELTDNIMRDVLKDDEVKQLLVKTHELLSNFDMKDHR